MFAAFGAGHAYMYIHVLSPGSVDCVTVHDMMGLNRSRRRSMYVLSVLESGDFMENCMFVPHVSVACWIAHADPAC